MKINRIEIKDFMGVNVQCDLTEPVNVFFGYNGSGKSALTDAIYWAVTGKLEHRGYRQKNQSNQLGKPVVDFFTSEGQTHRDLKSAFCPDYGPAGIDEAKLAVLLNPRSILTMKPAERQAVFGAIFRSDSTTDRIKTCCGAQMLDGETTAKIVRGLDEAQTWNVEKRRAAKRKLTDLENARPAPVEQHITIDGKKLDLTQMDLTQVHNDLVERQVQLRTLQNKPRPDVAALTNRAKELEQQLKGASEVNQNLLGGEKEQKKELAALKDQLVMKQQVANELLIPARTCEKMIEQFEKINGTCPTCHREIEPDQKEAILSDLNAQMAEAQQRYNDADTTAQQLKNLINAAQIGFDKIVEEVNSVAAQGSKISLELGGIKDQLKEAGKLGDVEAQINDLQRRVKNLTELETSLSAYVQAQTQNQQTVAGIKAMQQTIEECDRVDALLKPDGALRQIANADLEGVQFDTELAAAWGMETLTIKPDGTIEVFNRPLESASVSEKWRAMVLLSELLARAAKVGLLALDGVDILADTKGPFQAALARWADSFESVLVNCAMDSRPELQAPEHFAFWWVEAGRVEPLIIAVASATA